MSNKVERAVITAAGLGTRFLPETKNIPKEMLPVVDKPIIHYVVEECVKAGIKQIIIIIRPGNESVINYFSPDKALEESLKKAGKESFMDEYRQLVEKVDFIFVNQKTGLPYGNGSPILSAKSLVENGPFVVCFGDDLLFNPDGESGVEQIVKFFNNQDDAYAVLGTTEISKEEMTRYGMVDLVSGEDEGRVKRVVEKPKLEDVTSKLAGFGRMVLTPEIFKYLNESNTGKDGELWLMDAVEQLLKNKPVYAKKIVGEFLTTGDPLRLLKASVKYALQRESIGDDLKEFLKKEVE